MPVSTLRLNPHGLNRKTAGQDGVRFLLSRKALSSSTTCRFIPAHSTSKLSTAFRLTQPRHLLTKTRHTAGTVALGPSQYGSLASLGPSQYGSLAWGWPARRRLFK